MSAAAVAPDPGRGEEAAEEDARASAAKDAADADAEAAAAAEAALLAAQRSDPPVWRDELDDLRCGGDDDADDADDAADDADDAETEREGALPSREADGSPKMKKTKAEREAERGSRGGGAAAAASFAGLTAHTDGTVFEKRLPESAAMLNGDSGLPEFSSDRQETASAPLQSKLDSK